MIVHNSNMNCKPDIRDKHNTMNKMHFKVIFDNIFIVHSYDDGMIYIYIYIYIDGLIMHKMV